MDNFFYRPWTSIDGQNTRSQTENQKEECSCGKQTNKNEIGLTKNKGSGDISEISGGEEAKPNEFP